MDKRTLNAMLVGIGKGLQSYDPNNMFSGAGAALAATSGMLEEEETYKRRRGESEEDYQRRRGEARADRREEMGMMREERATARSEAREERASIRAEEKSALQENFERLSKLGLGGMVDSRREPPPSAKALSDQFFKAFGKSSPVFDMSSILKRNSF